MNILFLDDNMERIKKIKRCIKSLIITKTVEQTIRELEKCEEWNIVFLDHDLGGEEHVDSNRKDSGMEVARWIVNNNVNIHHIIVHTLNGPAGEDMVSLLKENRYKAEYVPFTKLIQNLENGK